MIIALVLLALGEVSLALELGNRLLGIGIRTPAKTFAKMCLIVSACILLALPALLLIVAPESNLIRFLFYLSAIVGILLFIHYLFPYRFGISTITPKHPTEREETLISNVALRDESVTVHLPASNPDGLRFLVVSDLHCNSQRKLNLIEDAFAKLNNEIFDAVLVLGDLSENRQIMPELIAAIAKLPNRYGIFCVRGNHDFENDRHKLIEELAKRHSIKILSNTVSKVPELGIELAGLEYPPDCARIPPKSEGTLRLGLTHTPDNILMLSELGVDIAVAGHTHGGWFRLPVLRPLLVPSGLGRFLNKGWYKRRNTLMYITSGLPYFAKRNGRKGEILRLTIKPGKEKEGIAGIEDSVQ